MSSTSPRSRSKQRPYSARDAGAVLVWSGTSPRKLLGFFPARVEPRRYGIGPPVLVGWTHPYAPLGTPLVERDAAEPVIAAWLAHLAEDNELPGLLLLPYLPRTGAVRHGARCTINAPRADAGRRFQSPSAGRMLVPGNERLLYVERTLGQHKHKELRRIVRRLGDTGRHSVHCRDGARRRTGRASRFLRLGVARLERCKRAPPPR